MANRISASGIGTGRLGDDLRTLIYDSDAAVIGIAAAFVSVSGVERASQIIQHAGVQRCRLVAGTDYAITHPEALRLAREQGWAVRIARRMAGVFHPKLIVAGDSFAAHGGIRNVRALYVGSGNLTGAAFYRNAECGLLADTCGDVFGASSVFSLFWNRGDTLTETFLKTYGRRFADRNRRRKPEELDALGISDTDQVTRISPARLLRQQPPRRSAIDVSVADAAWTGLQSFTGEYRFQIEFPRAAGEVIRQIVGDQMSETGAVDVYCPDDQRIRSMQYRFYPDNSMFRLNVPNDVAGVSWARRNRAGLALVERSALPTAAIKLLISPPGTAANEIIQRSVALGTWGRTTTRLYGWY